VKAGKPKAVEEPDFTDEDIAIADAIWDRIGKGSRQ
jgi:hypothetical protein